MRTGRAVALLAALALVVTLAPAASAHGGWRTYIVSAHDADTENGTVAWFTIDNRTQANPAVPLHANETVVLHLVNLGEVDHTLHVAEPIDVTIGPVPPGEEQSASFRVPEEATGHIAYEDPAWHDRGMRGAFVVNGTDPPRATPLDPIATIAGVLGAATSLAIARRRPAP